MALIHSRESLAFINFSKETPEEPTISKGSPGVEASPCKPAAKMI